MPHNNSIIKRLQVVVSFAAVFLLASLVACLYSSKKLVKNSTWVNHTNEVVIEADNLLAYLRDAESAQRGYFITSNNLFLEPYTEAREKVSKSYSNLFNLTDDNKVQQSNLIELKRLYLERLEKIEQVIDIKNSGEEINNKQLINWMNQGRVMMDNIRIIINNIKEVEKKLYKKNFDEQSMYLTYTPNFIIFTILFTLVIAFAAYINLKKDLDIRIVRDKENEKLIIETSKRINELEEVTDKISSGDYAARSLDKKEDEIGRIFKAINRMAAALEENFHDLNIKNWKQAGNLKITEKIRGEVNLDNLSQTIIEELSTYLGALVGTIYIIDEHLNFSLSGKFSDVNAPKTIKTGEGMSGQVLLNQTPIVVTDLPENYLNISSSTGTTPPSAVVIVPLIYSDISIGVIELAFLKTPSSDTIDFLYSILESISVNFNSVLNYTKMQSLLEETQTQAEELQSQHNELENLNTELEAQASKLQASEEELRVQQEELQQTNEELEERSVMLEDKNLEVQKKAEELEISTRYKSEFLANMSHELRTPLNSILLLSRLLSENTENNLSDDQIEFAKVILSSGNGLLGLIDEILDLSKIEAGKMSLDFEDVNISQMSEELQAMFKLIAIEKKLKLDFSIAPDVTPFIRTDKMRLEQILKNLLSNALKFTAEGSVQMNISNYTGKEDIISITVKDTGIGIDKEKQHLVFEAFQQADGSTKRKYGGTGLGLSISRELVKLLGGEISLKSVVNEGCEFTILLPVNGEAIKSSFNISTDFSKTPLISEDTIPETIIESTPHKDQYISSFIPQSVPDDRDSIGENDKCILIIEDDVNFAKSLIDYTRNKGYKAISAVRGDDGLRLALAYKPIGILLDVQLPIKSGWEVMDDLKKNIYTRQIPVHMMSSHHVKNESLIKGAIDFIDKPFAFEQMKEVFKKIEQVLSKESKQVLILEDNPKHAKALAYFLETFNIHSELKSDMDEAIQTLNKKEVDCVILDMGIPDEMAYELLEAAKKTPGMENLPIIIFTGKSLSMAEELKIKKYADSIVVKTAHSYKRMLDEVSLFLHLVEENKKQVNHKIDSKKLGVLSEILENKTVLIADDDVRNIFSLTKALEKYKMNVLTALDGAEAMEKIEAHPEIDVVLLDMMMPKMDGYETAEKIRENPALKTLPVIAVTAKAMTGDREKCIKAGASDYITKPVDIDQLVSLLRVWLYER